MLHSGCVFPGVLIAAESLEIRFYASLWLGVHEYRPCGFPKEALALLVTQCSSGRNHVGPRKIEQWKESDVINCNHTFIYIYPIDIDTCIYIYTHVNIHI